MSMEQAVWGTIIVVLAIYGGVSLVRDLSWAIVRGFLKLHTMRKAAQLKKARENYEKIPDCGGTVEGGLLAAEAILKGISINRFQRSRLGNI